MDLGDDYKSWDAASDPVLNLIPASDAIFPLLLYIFFSGLSLSDKTA